MGEIIVRYGCDDCGRLSSDPEEFSPVEIHKFTATGTMHSEFDQIPERILLCKRCLIRRERPEGEYWVG